MVRRKYVTQSATLRRSKHPSPAVATSQTKPDTANKNPTKGEHLELLERLKQLSKQIDEQHDRARWLGRPRIHTAIFEDVAKDERPRRRFDRGLWCPSNFPRMGHHPQTRDDILF
jgi:hypothetical protein